MGKRIISQNRGRGSPTYRAPSHRFKANLEHLKFDGDEAIRGKVVSIIHDTARNAPIAMVKLNDGNTHTLLAPEGVHIDEEISYGGTSAIKPGNTLKISMMPEGVPICNVEARPNDGGRFARASGVYATIVTHDETKTVIKLPSGKVKWLNPNCRATIGVVAGGGRVDKPFVKAGKKYHKMKSKASKYPRVRGVAMNAVDHPFGGGGRQHTSKPKTVARGAPAGRKVGSIAARRTGRR